MSDKLTTTLGDFKSSPIKNVNILIFTVLPILIGFYIYLISRTNHLLYSEWLSWFPSIKYYAISHKLNPIINFTNEFVIYSLPTALWAFSFGFTLNYLSYSKKYLIAGMVFISLFELGQLMGFLSGTFDFIDLLSSISAYILPYIILRGKRCLIKNQLAF